ncbi:MAG: YbhB/YbcL family Raf kinase inhibitor-like protein [Psychromonas sp.]|nr:YbhB/YbcL family Raf kinase inhibitor-like protein [Psychromonas sp.]
MEQQFAIHIDSWANGMNIPAKFAFGQPGSDTLFALSDNINPGIRWSHAPKETKSFAIICHDPDAPSSRENVNQEGKMISDDLSRVNFFHWVLVNIPVGVSAIIEGTASSGITPRGKPIGQTPLGMTGINDYTNWFNGDSDMEGIYGGYDGPCPPWNDSIVHHYHFQIFALDIKTLNLQNEFTGKDALQAMKEHILGVASHVGTYSMSPISYKL